MWKTLKITKEHLTMQEMTEISFQIPMKKQVFKSISLAMLTEQVPWWADLKCLQRKSDLNCLHWFIMLLLLEPLVKSTSNSQSLERRLLQISFKVLSKKWNCNSCSNPSLNQRSSNVTTSLIDFIDSIMSEDEDAVVKLAKQLNREQVRSLYQR